MTLVEPISLLTNTKIIDYSGNSKFKQFTENLGSSISKITLYQMTKILDGSKLKAFAGDKIYVSEKFKFVLVRVKKIMGKKRECWFKAFSPCHTMFSITFFFFQVFEKSGMCGKGLIEVTVQMVFLFS